MQPETGRFRQFLYRHNLKILWGVAIASMASNYLMYREKQRNPEQFKSSMT